MKQKLSYKNSLAVAATALAFLLAASSAPNDCHMPVGSRGLAKRTRAARE